MSLVAVHRAVLAFLLSVYCGLYTSCWENTRRIPGSTSLDILYIIGNKQASKHHVHTVVYFNASNHPMMCAASGIHSANPTG